MGSATDALRQIAQYLHPSTIKQLRAAGAVDARGPVALLRSLPWLLGRGPSLGVVSQMHSLALKAKPAVLDRRGSLTWAEVDHRANQAARLLVDAGVRPGERVALLLHNGREMVDLLLGAQKAGVVACPLNTWAKPQELAATLAGARPRLIVYDTRHTQELVAAGTGGVPLVHVGDDPGAPAGSTPYDELRAHEPGSSLGPFVRDRGSARFVIHTSGTTGTPKGAARDAAAAGMGALANILSVVPYRRDDIVLCPAPMFHSFGLATFTFATALGATMVLPDKFDAAETLALIEEHRATALSLVPVMIRRIVSLDEATVKSHDLSSLRILLASGSVLSEDLRRAATGVFGEVIYDLYGSTEAGWVAIATPQDIATHPHTVGRPVRGIEVAVFSPEGRRLPAGETGELFIGSDVLFEGYISGDQKDHRDGFMSIGDVGHLDAAGYLYIESRADDMVVVGGENVYPIEVEQVIEAVAGVQEVSVFGVPDEQFGQVLAAVVVGSVTPEQVEQVCRSALASYKIPRQVRVVAELPRTSTGKVLKRELVASITWERGMAPP